MKKFVLLAAVALLVFSTAALCGAPAPDAKKLFGEMQTKIKDVKSYKFLFDYEYVGGEKKESRKCDFMFMGRDFIRLEVLDGDDSGAKVAFNAKKSKTKVSVKKGFLKLNLGADDPRFKGFFETDWKSDLDELVDLTKGGTFAYNGPEKIKGRDADKITITSKTGKYSKIELWIDAKEKLLLQYKYYRADKYDSTKTFYDISLNPGLKEEQFVP